MLCINTQKLFRELIQLQPRCYYYVRDIYFFNLLNLKINKINNFFLFLFILLILKCFNILLSCLFFIFLSFDIIICNIKNFNKSNNKGLFTSFKSTEIVFV